MAEPVNSPMLKGAPRAGDFQTQIAELNASLQDWRRTRKYSQQTEERLAQITVQCARMAESWQQMDRRRRAAAAAAEAHAADRRGIERRVQPDPGERIRALERTIEHEWETLAEAHDDGTPRDPAPGVADNSLTLRGIAGFEARIAVLERDLQSRIEQLSNDLHLVLAELRSARTHPAGSPAAFPLESVMRIHEELRDPDANTAGSALKPGATRALPEWKESATALTARLDSLERAVGQVSAATPEPARGWRSQASMLALLAAVLVGMVLFVLWTQRQVDARLNEAAVRISTVETQRDATVAATRDEAARQVADARQSAAQAQIVGNVLAAPDRVRYWMGGAGSYSRAYAQILFSRSRGLVFSASRLPQAEAGKAYQLWMITRAGAVNAGTVTPDAAGRVTLASDAAITVPGRIVGALVTLEPSGGSTQPSGQRVLVRID